MSIDLTYGPLDTHELRGTTKADYLINVEADLRVVDGGHIVYEEPFFPVAELVRELTRWLDGDLDEAFLFVSLSWEDPGSIVISPTADGWTLGSDLDGSRSRPVCWSEMHWCVRKFIAEVKNDLRRLGVDPEWLFR